MTILNKNFCIGLLCVISTSAQAALSLDRTRVIFEGDKKSVSLNVANTSEKLPYLAQAWIENDKGVKIQSPFVVVPPVQRVEPGKPTQVKIEAINVLQTLPQDRESIFYFNLREIPPKSEKANVLQLALQTKIKLFYRPEKLIMSGTDIINNPWQEKVVLQENSSNYTIENPTPYYVTIVNIAKDEKSKTDPNFNPVMLAPFGKDTISVNPSVLGSKPVITYINDYGGRSQVSFSCVSNKCAVKEKG
ncbi:fimbria/pilus periplasmic chaperone [Proteus faecis]|uniref:Fimbria/pilus periplasmic chaperone n=1 Tax=Proteus faecis TaxID=2050967 RepID=A0AAW7CUQ1_9GAMM|nr:fimbria/pilus periplasmic chaperone [Proteus faecis]MBG3014503.1 fimbria/pilus periplasmic chaperone [Proteus mirabilis]MDO5405132.1 fimbria/pilus periplasmic chaperone [Proteus sp. (in: enterobacteria)]MDL5167917.1 fimbria/pilus periplasmic chaperone [Proteus faecis]MDL5275839.1 fimbria/pilus periplasmic chaperone [Proteus faecis]MDL5279406.1 fimbria/pilus periplasmic chaperone [Proteus faecis]